MKKKTGISLYLEELRTGKGLTQIELDKAAGLPVGTVGQLESGARRLSDDRLEKLAPVLGVTAKQLLLGSYAGGSTEMNLLLSELDGLSRNGLLELTLRVRKEKEAGLLI